MVFELTTPFDYDGMSNLMITPAMGPGSAPAAMPLFGDQRGAVDLPSELWRFRRSFNLDRLSSPPPDVDSSAKYSHDRRESGDNYSA